MKASPFLFFFLLLVHTLPAQTNDWSRQSVALNRQSLRVLGSWAAGNMVLGSVGWARGEGQNRYFHQMNVGWNAVNAALAVGGLLGLKKQSALPPAAQWAKHKQTEKILKINMALDGAYIATGLLLANQADARSRGYGQSLVLQGGFLLLFDTWFYARLHRHGKRHTLLEKISFSGQKIVFRAVF